MSLSDWFCGCCLGTTPGGGPDVAVHGMKNVQDSGLCCCGTLTEYDVALLNSNRRRWCCARRRQSPVNAHATEQWVCCLSTNVLPLLFMATMYLAALGLFAAGACVILSTPTPQITLSLDVVDTAAWPCLDESDVADDGKPQCIHLTLEQALSGVACIAGPDGDVLRVNDGSLACSRFTVNAFFLQPALPAYDQPAARECSFQFPVLCQGKALCLPIEHENSYYLDFTRAISEFPEDIGYPVYVSGSRFRQDTILQPFYDDRTFADGACFYPQLDSTTPEAFDLCIGFGTGVLVLAACLTCCCWCKETSYDVMKRRLDPSRRPVPQLFSGETIWCCAWWTQDAAPADPAPTLPADDVVHSGSQNDDSNSGFDGSVHSESSNSSNDGHDDNSDAGSDTESFASTKSVNPADAEDSLPL
jgi:hypothetical protein